MLKRMFLQFSFGNSLSVNFYLVTLLIVGFVAVEPYLTRGQQWLDDVIASRFANVNALLLRPAIHACGLLLFLVFDDRNTQFIYFQF